jgi:hypothetical protein
MENNEKKNSPVKTVYINDIESLNDSTENNEININYNSIKNDNNGIVKGKINNNSIDSNNLYNKNERTNFKINTLKKLSKIKTDKEKESKEKEKTNNNSNKKKDAISNNKKKLLVSSKYSDELDKNINNKLKTESNDLVEKNEINYSINKEGKENEFVKDANNKHKKKNNSNLNLIKESEMEMEKEIEYLKKEIRLKNNIIQKLIEDNKNLIEKIKKKEMELLNSKTKEENLTKVIQENNKCITNLNELIARLIPQNQVNNEKKNNKIDKKKMSKSKLDNINSYYIPKNVCSKNSGNNKVAERKINDYENSDKSNAISNDINLTNHNNKKIFIGNPVQRYFKLHHTRNNIKKHISLNQKNFINKINIGSNKKLKNNLDKNTTENVKNFKIQFNEDEKAKRHKTISIDKKRNKSNKAYFINDGINYSYYQIMKSLTRNNINKDNKYNIGILDDNLNELNGDCFKGNISCKNERINNNIEISPKKFDSNSYLNINDFFTFSNKDIKNNIISPVLSTRNVKTNNFNLDRSFNYKNILNLDQSLKENTNSIMPKLTYNKILYLKENYNNTNINDQSISKNNNNNKNSNFLSFDNLINERNNYYSQRNKDVEFHENQKG